MRKILDLLRRSKSSIKQTRQRHTTLHLEPLETRKLLAVDVHLDEDFGVRESAGINRLGIGNERVLQRRLSQSLWPRTVRW